MSAKIGLGGTNDLPVYSSCLLCSAVIAGGCDDSERTLAMNVDLLEKVKAHILEEPKRFDMALFISTPDDKLFAYPKCGTVACIAGWACTLSGIKEPANWESAGRHVLELNPGESDRLFYDESWPDEYFDEYHAQKEQSSGRAEAACKRIDHFIATKGAE